MEIITYGKGKPIVSIMGGLHGNEAQGMLIISEIIQKLKGFKGTIRVIPAVNKAGLLAGIRENPVDKTDLNRTAPGKADGTNSQRIVHELIGKVQDSNLVIDIHDFEMESPLIGVWCDTGSETSRKAKELLQTADIDYVWKVALGKRYSGTVGEELISNGVPYIAIESSDLTHNSQREREVNALVNIVKNIKHEVQARVITRHPYTSDHTGVFIPLVKRGVDVKEGDLIGEILLPNLKKHRVICKKSGTLIQIRRTEFVITGKDVYAIGVIE